MRRLATSTILFAALSLTSPVLAQGESEKPAEEPVQASVSEKPIEPASASAPQAAPAAPLDESTEGRRAQPTRDEICQLIESAADGESLPFEFFARLIWQESRFNPQAVSPAGAQGIAQFMPRTATGRGLANPFEPASALQESAEFLRELLKQFGNLGLAAAAYNAGPRRVQDWLAKRGALPRETQQYVHIITGHGPEKWAAAEPPRADTVGDRFQCTEIVRLVAQRRSAATIERLASLAAERLGLPRGEVPAKLAERRSARNGILGKRVAPQPGAGDQVAKAVAPTRGQLRVQKIIKITAHGRDRPQVQVIKVAASVNKPERAAKAAQVADSKSKVAKVADPKGKLANVVDPKAKMAKVADPKAKGTKVAAKVADQVGAARKTRSADKAARVQPAGKAVNTKSAETADRRNKKTAALRDQRPSDVGSSARKSGPAKARVATGAQASAEKQCTPAKSGGRKTCRAA